MNNLNIKSKVNLSEIVFLVKHIYRHYKKEIPTPLMCYAEIEFIKIILKYVQPMSCLEWGAGYSTKYFPKFLSKNAKWYSIEHNKNWFNKTNTKNTNQNVKIFLLKPDRFPWTDKYKDGAYSDLKKYIEFPTQFGKFDFILIDGRARAECIIKSYNLLKDNGIIVLHDAQRKHYHQSLQRYKFQIMLQGYKNNKKLWIGSKKTNVENIMNYKKLKRAWKLCSRFERLKKCIRKIFDKCTT